MRIEGSPLMAANSDPGQSSAESVSRPFLFWSREDIDRGCEIGILGLVLALLIFSPLATGAVRPLEFLVIQGLTMVILIIWLVRLWAGVEHRFLWPPIAWAVLAFLAYAIGRYFTADLEYVARQELIKIIVYAVLFFSILIHLHRHESVQIIVYVLVILGLGISIYACYQFITDSPYVWHFIKPVGYMKRGTGTFICPNHLAGYLEMIWPLGMAYLFFGKTSPATKIYLGYACLVILAGIGFSISRGGWIATAVSMMLLVVILLRYQRFRLPALLMLLVLAAGLSVFLWKAHYSRERFQSMFVAGKLEDIRFKLWKPAVQMWQENIWFGVGPAHFDSRFRQYRPEDVQMRPDRAHNDYLNTLTDWGIVGVLLVALPWVLLYRGVFKTWKYVNRSSQELHGKSSNKAAFVLGASISLFSILLHSWVDFNLHIPANAILAITLMALLSTHTRFATDQYWQPRGGLSHWAFSLSGLGILIFLGTQELRLGTEYWWLQQVKRESEYDPRSLIYLKKAYAVEPKNFKTAYDIGETVRILSWQGHSGYQELAQEAMKWFARAKTINPYYGYSYLRYGMCLDWLGRSPEAGAYFDQALKLDPNGYYTVAHMGWHLMQLGDYAGAKPWFERSKRLKSDENPIADAYLRIIERRENEAAKQK
jgi:O-antigen ligase